jgi:DNA polymerase III alpha subunit (gram-positive type)
MPCGFCKDKGHNYKNCPDLPCFQCQSTTHIKKNCPVFSSDQKEKRQNVTHNDKQIEADRERHKIENMTNQQINSQRDRDRVVNMNDEQKQAQLERDRERDRVRDRVENMKPEQIEAERERHRIVNMTDEQKEALQERDRERHRVENMNPEEIEAERLRHRVKEKKRPLTIKPITPSSLSPKPPPGKEGECPIEIIRRTPEGGYTLIEQYRDGTEVTSVTVGEGGMIREYYERKVYKEGFRFRNDEEWVEEPGITFEQYIKDKNNIQQVLYIKH